MAVQLVSGYGRQASSLPDVARASMELNRLLLDFLDEAAQCILQDAEARSAKNKLSPSKSRAISFLQSPQLKFIQCFALTPLPMPRSRR